MPTKLVSIAAIATAAAVFTFAKAQAPQKPVTVEDRIAALERQVASLDTQLALRSTQVPGGAGNRDYALGSRVDSL